jgi:anthranilate phosphoribosyltransferase
VFEALGIPLDLPPDAVESCLQSVGITFCFAPVFHPAMRFAGPVRREMGVPTIFNILGPLANPARPTYQLVGVADARVGPVVAEALRIRGTAALVVRGDDGLDEITTETTSTVWEVTGQEVVRVVIDPAEFGVPRPAPGSLRGGDASFNAKVAEAVLENDPGVADVVEAVCVNAAAALVASGSTGQGPLVERLARGHAQAKAVVADGSAAALLRRWRQMSQSLR